MTAETVLSVNSVSKRFKIYQNPVDRMKEWGFFGKRSYHKDFWAIKEITFQVHKGEFLGIIGPNGAGKSTLLKVITGVLDPTSGSSQASGRILSLLELSGGMDQELTGRENIIRSAQLLGFPDSYLKQRMQHIAEFAELGDFFDRPLRVYSSGMKIRLAFSLFAFVDCDVLILDEVLAVGDIFFKQKCYARLEELIKENTAIILVTHSTGVVRRYCDDVLLMNNGQIIFQGDTDQAIQKYFHIKGGMSNALNPEDVDFEDEEDLFPEFENPENISDEVISDWPSNSTLIPKMNQTRFAKLTYLSVCNERGEPRLSFRQGERAHFYCEYTLKENIGVPIAGIEITTIHNVLVHSKNTLQHNIRLPIKIQSNDRLRLKQVIRLDIAPGQYIINLTLFTLHPNDFSQLEALSKQELREKLIYVARLKPAISIEVLPLIDRRVKDLHGGMCNLLGEAHVQLLTKG